MSATYEIPTESKTARTAARDDAGGTREVERHLARGVICERAREGDACRGLTLAVNGRALNGIEEDGTGTRAKDERARSVRVRMRHAQQQAADQVLLEGDEDTSMVA